MNQMTNIKTAGRKAAHKVTWGAESTAGIGFTLINGHKGKYVNSRSTGGYK